VEAGPLAHLRRALATRRLAPAADVTHPFVEAPAGAGEPAVLATQDGACVFYRHTGPGRCAIHRALGHEGLPLACRQFPRVTIQDPRGTSVTLSHYCPTAAVMLDSRTPIAIIDDGPAFPAGGEYVGLDAREALPPLLRPDMLLDWQAWWEWERLSVAAIAAARSPTAALGRLHAAVERVRPWTPAEGPLAARVRLAFAADAAPAAAGWTMAERDARVREVLDGIPAPWRPAAAVEHPASPLRAAAVQRFLAAHAFANWTAYFGRGLRTWLRSVEAAYALISAGAGPARADLLLRHLADPAALARVWSAAETR
jgi:hypothetical protein